MDIAGKKVEYLKDDVLVNITISGEFYKRIQAVFIYIAQKQSLDEFKILYANMIQGNKPLNEQEFHLATVFGLLVEIENKAKEQDKVSEEDMEVFLKKMEDFHNKQKQNKPSES